MRYLRSYVRLLALLGAIALTGCVKVIPYTPRPATVVAPEKQVEEALNLSTVPPVEFEITDTYLKITQVVAGYGANTSSLRFSRVGSMKLQRVSGGFGAYRVLVEDASGDGIFSLWSKDLDTAQRFMDALAALVTRAKKGEAP
jgi:hypothetical protein